MNLYLDIETIPTIREDVREYIAASIEPPGNMSKPETIAKWIAESKPVVIEEAIHKTGLDGAFGRACVIGWALDDLWPSLTYDPADERYVLSTFAHDISNAISRSDSHRICVVGHNVSAFDLRFLLQRYIVHGIRPPTVIERAAAAKPWESDKVFDTMVQWCGPRGTISLDKLCMALGIPTPKTDLTGATVWEAVQAGRIEDVAAYCQGDVEAIRKIHCRMTFASSAAVAGDLQAA